MMSMPDIQTMNQLHTDRAARLTARWSLRLPRRSHEPRSVETLGALRPAPSC